MWRETARHERNAAIWREELDGFVPRRVLDFHVHVWNREVLPEGETYSCAGHPIALYDLTDLEADLAGLYPGRETAAVCFGLPDVRYDLRKNNAYVAEQCDGKRFFPFRLFDPLTETPEEIGAELTREPFLGIKPYLDYVRKADPNQVEVREMLPPWIMDIVDELGLIVMLHIPRRDRLADPINQRQIVELCETYPRARIVLAHIGRAYFLRNIAGQLDTLKALPNLYYDLAMLNHWEVLEYLFQQVPADRILYATDTPIALAPGKSVEINHQYTYVTPVPWALSISDDHGKLRFTSFAYEELRAIKRAVERAGLGEDFVRKLFHENGERLLASVTRPCN
ncbi:MAG: Amidohydrolase family protein [Candidatus Hydrogenedentes bacterium]|nr:Amidohydrolase family protein [Candidatus Hydrogenedentota bacterium]